MKRLFFSLLAIGLAVGGSAFTNATTKHFAAFNYILNASGQYVLTSSPISEAGCQSTVVDPCWVGFTTSQCSSFPASTLPSKSPSETSPDQGIYIAP